MLALGLLAQLSRHHVDDRVKLEQPDWLVWPKVAHDSVCALGLWVPAVHSYPDHPNVRHGSHDSALPELAHLSAELEANGSDEFLH